jgi:hypothetical protein
MLISGKSYIKLSADNVLKRAYQRNIYMLLPLKIKENSKFRGRNEEQKRMLALTSGAKACIIVVHGRRRVGKTELIEQTLRRRKLLKFEGLEKQSKKKQLDQFARTLKQYIKDKLAGDFRFKSWVEAFETVARYVKDGKYTLYLEELQWLANYQNELVSSFKHVWDNHFRHNPKFVVIMCGSAPSFMINKVLHSSALYNRTEENFPVRPLTFPAVKEFFGKRYDNFEIMDAMLTVGAIPPYLEKLREAPSVFIGLAQHSFKKDAYFAQEYDRIFTSSMADNPDYKQILKYLATRSFSTKNEIADTLKRSNGGGLSDLLKDLEQTGFIISYSPLDKDNNSRLKRYQIADPYIRFYQHFIYPLIGRIKKGNYDLSPERALNNMNWQSWMGLNFEWWLRQQSLVLARILGFEGVHYDSGAYFSRASPKTQIDIVFERADRVTTLIEAKYTREPVGTEVIQNFKRKCELYPRKNRSIQKVLVSAAGATSELIRTGYFDRVIQLDELAKPEMWQL